MKNYSYILVFPTNVIQLYWSINTDETKANFGLSATLTNASKLIGKIGNQLGWFRCSTNNNCIIQIHSIAAGTNAETLNATIISPLSQMSNSFKSIGNYFKKLGQDLDQTHGLSQPNATDKCFSISNIFRF